jgi:FkbM family methyltransferase
MITVTVKQIIQSCFLKTYEQVLHTGIFTTSWGQSIFHTIYDWYKMYIEVADILTLQNYVKPGEVVIDIGANVGFFTKRFARWVSENGFVIAVEPETSNFYHLCRNLEKSGKGSVVRTVQGVAAEQSGTLKLAVNPIHPGDHKIAEAGVDVKAFTIDELVRKEPNARVCLMKIDVQGAEERVLRGAQETIERDYPAILVELDDEALRKMGSSTERVVNWLMGFGYVIQQWGKNSPVGKIQYQDALEMCCNGRYIDLLFVKTASTSSMPDSLYVK